MVENKFEVVVEPQHVRDAEPALAAAWIRQHRRCDQALEQRFAPFSRRNAFRAIQILAPLALGLSLLLIAVGSTGRLLSAVPITLPWLAVGLGALTVAVFSVNHDQATRWLYRVTDRLIHRAVRKVVQRTVRRAPFSVTYELKDREVLVKVPSLGIAKRIQPHRTALARRTGPVYLFYARPNAQRWSNIVYVGTSEQDEALHQFLQRHHVELEIDPTAEVAVLG